jgi:signal transduction histidine kinase
MPEYMGGLGRPPARSLPEALVRTLRHEVGDMLQKVYASVAILKDRLPTDRELERGVLTRLWSRAETCKRFIDTAHDFVCPVTLEYQSTDLAQIAEESVGAARARFPQVKFTTEALGMARVMADARRVAQTAEILLANAAEAAQHRVHFRTAVLPGGEVEWAIADDGPGLQAEHADALFRPFFTTRAGHAGLGLALAQKLIRFHGGEISAGNLTQGGFQVLVVFPAQPPPGEPA